MAVDWEIPHKWLHARLRSKGALSRVQPLLPCAIDQAQRLLLYAQATAKELPAGDVKNIVDAKLAKDGNALDAETTAAFWVSLGKLSALTQPVTLHSVSSAAETSAAATKRLHRLPGIFLLLLIIPISTANLLGPSFIKDVYQKIDQICDTETAAIDCKRIVVKLDQDVKDKLLLRTTTLQIYNDMWWVDLSLAGKFRSQLNGLLRSK